MPTGGAQHLPRGYGGSFRTRSGYRSYRSSTHSSFDVERSMFDIRPCSRHRLRSIALQVFRLIRRRASPPHADLRAHAPLRLHSTEASPTATSRLQSKPPQRSPSHRATFPPPRARLHPAAYAFATVNACVRASLRRFPPLRLHRPGSARTRLRSLRECQLRAEFRHSATPSMPEAAWVPPLLRTISDYAEFCVVFLSELTT